jgi:hypothetical protein
VGKICSFVSSVGARMLSNGAFMELCLKHSLICSVNLSFHVKNSNASFLLMFVAMPHSTINRPFYFK